MALNNQGIISVVSVVVYVPLLVFAVRLVMRYGLAERAWLSLVVFLLIRVVGNALLIAAELIVPPVIGLYIGGYALEASGLSPVLLSTLGLLEILTEGPSGEKQHGRKFRILHLIGIGALILMIIGISSTSNSSTANLERRVGVLLFMGLYVILLVLTIFQWMSRGNIMRYRKQLLVAVSVALPFLGIRTLYSVLSTFSSSTFISTSGEPVVNTGSLAKFNMFSGSWQIFLVMDVIMEFIVVFIYVAAGTKLPLDQDYRKQESDEYPLYPEAHY